MRIYVPPTEGRRPFSVEDVRDIVGIVSTEDYDENLMITSAYAAGANNIALTIGVKDADGPGARVVNGRHYSIACWHAYQDVLDELYERFPNARVTTGVAKYISAEHFDASYDVTGERPLDSRHPSLRVMDACDCKEVHHDEG